MTRSMREMYNKYLLVLRLSLSTSSSGPRDSMTSTLQVTLQYRKARSSVWIILRISYELHLRTGTRSTEKLAVPKFFGKFWPSGTTARPANLLHITKYLNTAFGRMH